MSHIKSLLLIKHLIDALHDIHIMETTSLVFDCDGGIRISSECVFANFKVTHSTYQSNFFFI